MKPAIEDHCLEMIGLMKAELDELKWYILKDRKV
jgi:hypothetical protein